MWDKLDNKEKANVISGLRSLGLATATGLLFAYGPGGWIGIALK